MIAPKKNWPEAPAPERAKHSFQRLSGGTHRIFVGVKLVRQVAAATLEARAVAATVLIPEGGDFNDDLATLGAPVARLAPFLGP